MGSGVFGCQTLQSIVGFGSRGCWQLKCWDLEVPIGGSGVVPDAMALCLRIRFSVPCLR